MSESESVKNIRRGYEAFNSGAFDAAIELVHPDIELRRFELALEPETLYGAEAMKAWMMPDIFDEQNIRLEKIVENGEKILVEGLFRVRARGSGIEIEDRAWHVWTMRDGKAARLEFYNERAEAEAAAGLDDTTDSPA